MKKRKTGLLIVLFFSIFVVAACTNKNEATDQEGAVDSSAILTSAPTQALETSGNLTTETATPTPAITAEVAPTLSLVQLPKAPTEYVSDEMYKNAMLNEGNLTRLAAVMKKARNGEEITVAVIGGSITQGSLATGNNGYANVFSKWWTEAFPNAKINFVNAGLGGTTSYLGVHRADKDLLAFHPDVVVVEFSVNDSDSLFFKETYEDLVRRIMKQENNPAVIQLFMTQENGTSAQAVHLHVGFWYNLPRISYREAILTEIEKGTFTWDEISPDNIHPNDKGHAMVGEILWDYLNSVYAKLDSITEDITTLLKDPQFSEAYFDATILDSTSIKPTVLGSFEASKVYDRFPNDWTTKSGEDALVFETEAQNIGIMYFKTVDGLSGQFDVYVDGVMVWTLNADFTGGWGNYPDTVEVYKSKKKSMHTIEIKKSEGSTGDVFSVLGLLIS